MPGTSLFVIPTPIGNLSDITLRALEVLKNVDLILAEDTRKSGILLKHYDIKKPLRSYHNFNERALAQNLVTRMQQGDVLALISDAGTPLISDPGYVLVNEAINAGLSVEALPGPTAFLPALIKSGFPVNRFVFEGFLPAKKGRNSKIKEITSHAITTILYESPHRLLKTLNQLQEHCEPDRKVSVSRELTKVYEETITGTLSEVIAYYQDHPVKGELVVILEGRSS